MFNPNRNKEKEKPLHKARKDIFEINFFFQELDFQNPFFNSKQKDA